MSTLWSVMIRCLTACILNLFPGYQIFSWLNRLLFLCFPLYMFSPWSVIVYLLLLLFPVFYSITMLGYVRMFWIHESLQSFNFLSLLHSLFVLWIIRNCSYWLLFQLIWMKSIPSSFVSKVFGIFSVSFSTSKSPDATVSSTDTAIFLLNCLFHQFYCAMISLHLLFAVWIIFWGTLYT